MNLQNRKVLYINLNKSSFEFKHETDLVKYIGGTAAGFKIYLNRSENDPLIFSTGPLNGYFPYCSKTSVILDDDGVVEDIYLGGGLSSRIKFAGIDHIVFEGSAASPQIIEIDSESVVFKAYDTEPGSLGLPGRKSVLLYDKGKEYFLLDNYFTGPQKILDKKLINKNIFGVVISATKNEEVKDPLRYEELLSQLLSLKNNMLVTESNHTSCVNCPMGCEKSKTGEFGGNILVHSLVACEYSSKIFSDVNIAFACLNYLGYNYTHEDLENFPQIAQELIKALPK